MEQTRRRALVALSGALLAPALGASRRAQAQAGREVTIAYQQIVGPLITLIGSGTIERATGYRIDWRQFDSGAKVATAMTSGDVQVGVIGSSPLAATVSRGVDLQLVWILDDINEAEALVVRNGAGIDKPADLRGKRLGVPFVSTTHYHTMAALEQWGLKPADVRLLNLQPNQIAAAWERGDIDAAYVWDPALARIKQSGRVLLTSGELSRAGKPTFDGIAAERKWAERNAEFMARFVRAVADADQSYRANAAAWSADGAPVKAIAARLGGEPADIAAALRLYAYPTLEQQASPAWLGGGAAGGAARALKATAEFLKAQGRIDALEPDYGRFVTSRYVEAAMALR